MKPTIVYDDRCLFCIGVKSRIDTLAKDKFNWVGISKFDYKKYKLKKDDLLKEMHLIENDKVYKGYFSFKQMSKRIPLLFPLYILMLIPGIDFIGNKIYNFIAKHRLGI